MAALRIAFLMDPIEGVEVGHDTSFLLMLECARRGHEVWHCEQRHLFWRDGGTGARLRRLAVHRRPGSHYDVLDEQEGPLAHFDVLFLRKDPPVDVEFLHATHLADLAGGPFVLNAPAALRDANEKLYALAWPDLLPRTLVSRDLPALRRFLDEVGGEMVVKPIDGFGGRGIFLARRGDRNLASILEVATRRGLDAVVAQEYLPASRLGDKRVVVLDGEPIGALQRVPSADDVRGNLAVGGRAEAVAVSDRDREICARLAPDLRRRGLWFVGLDVIGDRLTEVNVTSPTGLEEIDRLGGLTLERDVVDFVERKAAERRAGATTAAGAATGASGAAGGAP